MSRSTTESASAVSLPTPKERRRLREALALSEEQVAEAVGVTKATVKAWETGRSAPRGRKREAYAKLLATAEHADLPADLPADGASVAETSADGAPPPSTPTPAAGVRPRATAKRAAKPPKAPSPSPAIAQGPARRPGAWRPQEQERLKRTAAPAEPGERATEPVPEVPGPDGAPRSAPATAPALTPEEAFDALYAYAAPGLVHQAYLLTGRRELSREAVEHAFRQAWERWPEVAVDADPVGWVRAAAHEYALSPWHRLRRAHKHPDAPPTEARRRALLAALLELPPPYRRTVLLYDGLGLDLPDTAAETEASTPAAANRLLHARAVIADRVPELAEPEALQERLGTLVAEAPTATLPAARAVRTGGERRIRRWTRAVIGMTAVLIGVTAVTAATAPTRYIPVNAPGQSVGGVPLRGGPQQLDAEDVVLRDMLRSQPHPGPERLVPYAG
ncbi:MULTISPECIES: sigma factor-like helix-turn-helix DNA-binding protein [unclassified Streptomyces]|uniref:sigma factor-like helix-turn-helix DNA-binding protein n=1 Tax=unclassified Streptomyces TaxID=2593676 RepID=UPI0036AFD8F3